MRYADCVPCRLPRYTDEVRKVIKLCYEEVWTMLEEHKDALWGGIR